MSDLYDANSDDATGGDCCSRITYVEYPQILCNGIDCIKQMQEQTNSVPTQKLLLLNQPSRLNIDLVLVFQLL